MATSKESVPKVLGRLRGWLRGPELRRVDVCCFSPAYDITQMGAQLIARCFLEGAARSACRAGDA